MKRNNLDQVQTKIGEGCTRFQTTTAPKNIPFGTAHTYKETIIKGSNALDDWSPLAGVSETLQAFLGDQTAFQQCLFVLNIGKTMAGIDTLLKTNHLANLFTIQNFAAKKVILERELSKLGCYWKHFEFSNIFCSLGMQTRHLKTNLSYLFSR